MVQLILPTLNRGKIAVNFRPTGKHRTTDTIQVIIHILMIRSQSLPPCRR